MSDSDLDDEEEEQQQQEQLFTLATDHVRRQVNVFKPADLLEFYAYYKQASEGPCLEPRPNVLQMKARSKWNAWHELGKMSTAEAQQAYIEKLQHLEPEWEESRRSGTSSMGWVVHSIEAAPHEEQKPENEKNMFDYVKEHNLQRLREQLKPEDLLLQDENGMALIHWATDRNAVDILKLLVERGAKVNQRDAEQQTPLHYAASCGHVEALDYLLNQNADIELCDAEGQNCMDVADDEQICGLLKAKKRLLNTSLNP